MSSSGYAKDFAPSLPLLAPDKAASLLSEGGILIFPTETYYAIGCNPLDAEAVQAVFSLKKRPLDKPAPLVCASFEQAAKAADASCAPGRLLSAFWPGPLTVLLPALMPFAPALIDKQGRCAIRVTAGKIAQTLSESCGFPLLATSANLSGRPPASSINGLDPEFLAACAASSRPCAIARQDSEDKGLASPSTIIACHQEGAGWRIQLLRAGAIDKAALEAQNF